MSDRASPTASPALRAWPLVDRESAEETARILADPALETRQRGQMELAHVFRTP